MYNDRINDIFFDLDHTLWDFERNSALAYRDLFREYALGVNTEDFLRVYAPLNLKFWKLYREARIDKENLRYQRLRQTFDALGHPIEDEVINLLAEGYIQKLSGFPHLLPGTQEILEYLRPKYRLHIITNGFQEIQRKKLENSGISSYFSEVIDAEMAGVRKPDPRIFQLAMERSRATASKSMMIGDSLEADILGARALGMHTIHLNVHQDEDHDHGHVIRELHEIKTYL